jgi:CheY-like chemotaxis protein
MELAATKHRRHAPRLDCLALVVDDRRDIRFLSQHFLEQAGARVKTAQNGLEAIEMIVEAQNDGEPFDVIVLDMQMPEMDGYEAAARLRSMGIQTPIIALTAGAMKGDREDCLKAGCDEYLSKPIDGRSLVEIVSRFAPHHLAGPVEPVSRQSELSPRRVLIVDDSRDAATALARLLELAGHSTAIAGDGRSALEVAEQFQPELVLLDLQLPDTNGYALLPQFRNNGAGQPVVVAYTGNSAPNEEERIRQAGFDDYLIKPVDIERLEAILANSAPAGDQSG